jgi:hypothetical protein
MTNWTALVLITALVCVSFIVIASMIVGVDGTLRTSCIGIASAAVGAVVTFLAKKKG